MKTNFKRLFALLLTLCMLASLMVPVAFAEDEATAAPSATAAETYPIRVFDLTQTNPAEAAGNNTWFISSSTGGYKTQNMTAVSSNISKAYTAGTLNWKFVAASGEYIYRIDQMMQARLSSKAWAALQIRVSDAGMYALNMTVDKTVDTETETTPWTNGSATWAGDVTAYIIPVAVVNNAIANAVVAEGETAEVVGISGLMTEEYCVGTVSMAADQTDITFAKTRMESGEYVIVYTASTNNFSICEMSLLETAEDAAKFELTEIEKYGIQLVDPATMTAEEAYNSNIPEVSRFVTATSDEAAGTTTYAYITSSSGVAISRVGESYYNNGTLNWKWLEGAYNYRPAYNFQLRLDAAGVIAFQIKVPTAGKYALTLSTASAGTYTANAYVLNVNDVPADNGSYLALAVAENSIGDATVTAEKAGAFDAMYYEAGEYIVILSNTTGGNLPIQALGLSQYAIDAPVESDKVTGTVGTYDFEIYELDRYAPMFTTSDGNMSNRSYTNRTLSALEGVYEYDVSINPILVKDYEAGLLNYKYVGIGNGCSTSIRGEDKLGVRIQKTATTEAAAAWIAYEIQVPTTGIYTVELESEYGSNSAFSAYVLAADADIASSLTEENKAASFAEKADNLIFAAEFTAGANLVVFQLPETTEKVTIYLSSMTLSVLEDTVTYDFGLSNDANFIAALREAVGDETAVPQNTTLKKWTYESVEFNPYITIADLFAAGKMNWALDASSGTYADALQDDGSYKSSGSDMQNFRGGATLRLSMESDAISYVGLRINVPYAGTYNITTTFGGGAADLYLIKAPNAYDEYSDRLNAGGKNGALRDLIAAAYPFASIDGTTAVGTYTFNQAGEYVLAVVQPVAVSTNLYLSTMVMEPVEVNYIADGKGYATFDEAVAAATESIVLLQNTQAGNLVINPGVTLDLNGYMLYASSVDATAPGAQIVDGMDGKGLIRGEIEFNEANAQLPLYDVEADGYYLFNVDVASSATTGSGSHTKYWFKVNFSNPAVFDLIGANTELRVKAYMSGTYKAGTELEGQDFSAVASADAAFSCEWAANNTSYIVVDANSEAVGINPFSLAPAVTANGVVISGTAMGKG